MPPFQKQPFADVLHRRYSFKVFLWILRNITAFFIEHIWWLLLRFTSTFENYPLVAASAFCQHFRNSYWEDLSVTFFTLTHPSKRLNTCLRLITEKIDQGVNLFKNDNKQIKKVILKKSITVSKEMFIVHQKRTWQKSQTCD